MQLPSESASSASSEITPSEGSLLTHLIRCAGSTRYAVFIPSQNMLVIHEQDVQRKIELGYSTSRILDILINQAGQIVSREQIFTYAWPDRVVGPNSLNQAISTVRELLGDEEHRTIIQTIPRRGYQLNPEFLSSVQQPGREPTSFVPGNMAKPLPMAVRWIPRKQLQQTLLAVLVTGLLVSLVWRFDWGLWSQAGLLKDVYTQGDLTVLYTAPHREELKTLQLETSAVRERILKLLDQPTTVIFNMMHGYYDIVCIDHGTAGFVSVHKDRLDALTDEQLLGCLK